MKRINRVFASIMLAGLPLSNGLQLVHALDNEIPVSQEAPALIEVEAASTDGTSDDSDIFEVTTNNENLVDDADTVSSDSESMILDIDEDKIESSEEFDGLNLKNEIDADYSLTSDKNNEVEHDSASNPVLEKELNHLTEEFGLELVAEFTLDDYKKASAVEMAQLIKEGVTTPEQLLEYAFEMIKITNPELNNIITIRPEMVLEELAAMKDTDLPFYGVPILVKGLGHTVEGGSNTNGVEYLKDQVSTRSSNFVRKLQEAGFVVIGQTSYPQMGWINVTNSDLYGNTHNPWDLNYNPGGSSGGSSAAVAIGQVPIATTSDAGGSTRIPASFSGLIGLHPSRGILEGNATSVNSQTSHFAIMHNMDDLNQLFDVLLKERFAEDVNDPLIQLNKSQPIAYTYNTPAGTPIDMEAIQAVRKAVEFLESQGYTLVEVDYPVDGKAMMYDYYTIAASGATSLSLSAERILGRPMEKDDVELLTWALYQTGQDLDKEDTDMARENIARMTENLAAFYKQYPVLLTASTAYPAPAADYNHIPKELIPLMEDMSHLTKEEKMDLIYEQWLPAWIKTPYTQLANLTGTPSLSLPTHLTADGLPLGVMFNSGLYQDRLLLQIGELFNNHDLLITYYRTENELEKVSTPYQVEYKFTDELPEGQTKVLVHGQAGQIVSLYTVEYEGTKEVGRQMLDESISEPVSQVILIGTKVTEAGAPKEQPSDPEEGNELQPDFDSSIDEDLNEDDLEENETDLEHNIIEEAEQSQETLSESLPLYESEAEASLETVEEMLPLFDFIKRQLLNDFMLELDQNFESFTPENEGEMLGFTFPIQVLEHLAINNQKANAYWFENVSSPEEGDYVIVAAFHNEMNYYLFGFIDGRPVVLESQQNELGGDQLIHFQVTENKELQDGFQELVNSGISIP